MSIGSRIWLSGQIYPTQIDKKPVPSTESETMSDTRYIILIEIDNKRAAKLYREAHDGIETLWPGIEAYCAPTDKEKQEEANAEMAEYLKDTGESRLFRLPPYHYGRPYLLINRFTAQRSTIKRGLAIASQAISPYKVTEEQALLLADIESGDWIRRIENAINSIREPK